MKIWKNTSTLDGFDHGLEFTEIMTDADIVLMGSKFIEINQFPNLKGIFRAGVGRDNVPEEDAKKKGIIVRFPSDQTINIIFDETASFTCSLIFRMLYNDIGAINSWMKAPRQQMSVKNLLVIGMGKIGSRVAKLMRPFIKVSTFDVLQNEISGLKSMIQQADCISIHIPKSNENISFFDKEKLSWMKDNSTLVNAARGAIVDEDALYNEISSLYDSIYDAQRLLAYSTVTTQHMKMYNDISDGKFFGGKRKFFKSYGKLGHRFNNIWL